MKANDDKIKTKKSENSKCPTDFTPHHQPEKKSLRVKKKWQNDDISRKINHFLTICTRDFTFFFF